MGRLAGFLQGGRRALEPTTLYYEDIPGSARGGPLLVLLHGRGADENDLPPIVDYVARGWNAVSVRAPIEFPQGGFAWYEFTPTLGPQPESLQAGTRALLDTLADIRESYPDSPTVLLGFSQGALMALVAATARPAKVQGVAALSGYLPRDDLLPAPLRFLKNFPVFQSHARNDFLLPFVLAEGARDRLITAGADITWIEHEAGHTIPLDVMERLATWLERAARRPP